jgi:hypothetical protein
MEKKSYLRLGGLQNKSGEKLISKVRRTIKNLENKWITKSLGAKESRRNGIAT